MVQSKTSFYTIKHGHLHGRTRNTKEYYSFNTGYINGFRNKYGIITSTITNEFYRAIYLLSICWFHGGHLLIVNTTEKYSQFLYNLFYFGKQEADEENNLSERRFFQGKNNKFVTKKEFSRPSRPRKYQKKFCTSSLISFEKERELSNIELLFKLRKSHNRFEQGVIENKISISLAPFGGGGTVTNWKQLFRSLKRGNAFNKKFGKFIYENDIPFPPYKKLKQSAVQFIDRIKTKKISKGEGRKPDCILIIGNSSVDILRDSFYLDIPTIATVDTHFSVDYCTFPVWGNTSSIEFLWIFTEWFFRSYCKSNFTSL